MECKQLIIDTIFMYNSDLEAGGVSKVNNGMDSMCGASVEEKIGESGVM